MFGNRAGRESITSLMAIPRTTRGKPRRLSQSRHGGAEPRFDSSTIPEAFAATVNLGIADL